MGRRDRNIRAEGRSQFRQFLFMNQRLHEMLRFLGEQKIQNNTIKLDQFQKLRQQFIKWAEEYELANNKIKNESDQMKRAKLLFTLMQNKNNMEDGLRQMTSITLKLYQKIKRQKGEDTSKPSSAKKKNGYQEALNQEITSEDIDEAMSPLQKELQYKKLIVYTFEKNYFKLIGEERKQVNKIRKDLNNNKYNSLQDFKKANLPIDRLLQQQREETLEERQVLLALKSIDNMIEERMDNILQGIKIIHQNAITISGSLDRFHTKVMINLDKIQHNNTELMKNQKRMDEAVKVVSKPSCIINIIIVVLLGLLAFLIVKIVWFS